MPTRLPKLPSTLERICCLTNSQLVLVRPAAAQAVAHSCATIAASLVLLTLAVKSLKVLTQLLQAPHGVLIQ